MQASSAFPRSLAEAADGSGGASRIATPKMHRDLNYTGTPPKKRTSTSSSEIQHPYLLYLFSGRVDFGDKYLDQLPIPTTKLAWGHSSKPRLYNIDKALEVFFRRRLLGTSQGCLFVGSSTFSSVLTPFVFSTFFVFGYVFFCRKLVRIESLIFSGWVCGPSPFCVGATSAQKASWMVKSGCHPWQNSQ